jgi:hypothetical protein
MTASIRVGGKVVRPAVRVRRQDSEAPGFGDGAGPASFAPAEVEFATHDRDR